MNSVVKMSCKIPVTGRMNAVLAACIFFIGCFFSTGFCETPGPAGMMGLDELKDTIEITDAKVDCPVKGCAVKVDRQRRSFKKEDKFKCPAHNIYISPSAFEYADEKNNLLWSDKSDMELLDKIRLVKRESRMGRSNSEDAVTWNVFRFLEKNNLLDGFLSSVSGSVQKSSEIIYWSFNQKENNSWSELNRVREEFGEEIKSSSEPDIMVKTDKSLFIIEAKMTAKNETVPAKPEFTKKYKTGGGNWFPKVFRSDYNTVAIDAKKYELMRYWLLGSWLAKQLNADFYLVSLVLSEREKDADVIFKKHIFENGKRKFKRITWEDIYSYICNDGSAGRDRGVMTKYFINKTIGYDRDGKLQKAFSVTE